LAKLMLNNWWGKLSERVNQTKYRVIADSVEWIELISNEQYQVSRVHYTNNKYLKVFYRLWTCAEAIQRLAQMVLQYCVFRFGNIWYWFAVLCWDNLWKR
jgi:hypothetical protein